jgi:flagellar L-ring protein precursor FlgH
MTNRIFSVFAGACVGVVLSGCNTVPQTNISSPLSARPTTVAATGGTSGAIYQASTYRPMFEDRKPRFVGDILTISINERTSAGKQSGSSGSKSGSVAFAAPKLFGIPAATTADLGLNATSSGKYESKGAESASNTFSGTIGATVVEVLSNGNLVVAGEKQIGFDQGSEFIRFYGVVNPDSIGAGNVVSSAQVADAKVEYRTNSQLDKAAVMTMLSRFFLSVLPL